MKTKRLTSKDQIIRKIDMFTKRKLAKEEQIRSLLIAARELREGAHKTGDSSLLAAARRTEGRSDAVGKRVVVLDRKLSNFKNLLAEFQTEPIPGFLPDNSVEAPQ